MTIKTTRIASGIYAFNFKGVSYEVERWEDGMWLAFEVSRHGNREFMQQYWTKAGALADIEENA